MTDESFSVASEDGSAGGHGGLGLVIDEPTPGVRVVQVAGELDLLTVTCHGDGTTGLPLGRDHLGAVMGRVLIVL